LHLRTVTRTSPLNAALKDGRVSVDGFELEFEEVQPITRAFRIMCRELAYDVVEMAATTYLVARAAGKPFTALPVFPVRGFPQSHAALMVRRDSGIKTPRDLEGRRVGARAYTGTASLWVRGVLRGECGVDLDSVTWVSAEEEHVPQYQADAPSNAVYDLGCDIEALLGSGELDAAIGVRPAENLLPLIPNARAAAAAFYKRTGVYQINHTLVVRDAVLAAHPGLADAIYDAFVEAKDRWLKTPPASGVADELGLPDSDPFPYGINGNAASIEALLRYAFEQKLTAYEQTANDLFISR